jgi:hypothetical protein
MPVVFARIGCDKGCYRQFCPSSTLVSVMNTNHCENPDVSKGRNGWVTKL